MCLPRHKCGPDGGDLDLNQAPRSDSVRPSVIVVRSPHAFYFLIVFVFISCFGNAKAQTTASLEGQLIDQRGAVVSAARITLSNPAIGLSRVASSDREGRYQFAALPVGNYRVEVKAEGFKTQVVNVLLIEVGRKVTQSFLLELGDVSQTVTITGGGQLIEHSTTSVGHVMDRRMVQDLPLNGRYFLDLGLLVPGSVTSPQGAFSSAPIRGLGSFAITTAGNREETVNYVINGISLNNLTFSSINFQPSIGTVQEFKVDNSTFSAEYGQSSGSIVNIATRSGANEFHGEVFEFLRNDALDARNFFTLTSSEPPPFKRNQFGGQVGGPILKDKLFFFFSYEGLRQIQQVDLNSLVLSDAQRAEVTDPVIARLVPLIPRANFFDSQGNPRFVGAAEARVNADQWTIDISHTLGKNDRLHGYYDAYKTRNNEPNRNGNTVPGFGNSSEQLRQVFTLNETHFFSAALVNELRLGFNRFSSATRPSNELNPADLGIDIGVTQPIGLPQISVAGGLNFGGPSTNPSGRGDTMVVVGDAVNYRVGEHSLKFGGEYRQFFNNNFR
jgi:Carboxypeptidase regulatory-like domain